MSSRQHISSSDARGPWSGRCAESLICPVCAGRLFAAGRQLRCARGHSFDVAREGYVNLFVDGHGISLIRGDTRRMLQARRRVMERGCFDPIADAVAAEVDGYRAMHDGARRGITVVDAGCGEGYYTGRLLPSHDARGPADDCFIGLDVSRDAVRMAARRYPRGCFLVNDVRRRITLADGSVDVLLDIFAPRHAPEMARVLRPSGLLVVVIPLTDHLAEPRARWPLIGIEPEKRERTVARLGGLFRPVGARRIEYTIVLPGGHLADLLEMTPSHHHLDASVFEEAASLDRMPVTVAVEMLLFMPRAAAG